MRVSEERTRLEKLEADRFFATVNQYIKLFGVEHMPFMADWVSEKLR